MEKITHFSSTTQPWGKSHTPKRYISPPFSENIITLWPSTMVCIGEICGGKEPQIFTQGKIAESKYESSVIAFLYKEQLFDQYKVTNKIRDDGIPVHTVCHTLDDAEFELETFCNTDRVSTVFARATITNTSESEISDVVTLVSRTGPEFDLLGICEPDGYTRSEPSLHRMKLLPPWKHKCGCMTDGTYSVYYKASGNVEAVDSDSFSNNFTDKDGIYFYFTLKKGEKATIDLCFGRGNAFLDFCYESEKQKTVDFWEKELSKITSFPNKNDPFTFKMFRSLVAQGLQMFNYPKDCDYIIMRQGSIQRRMWPTENRSMIQALSIIGDFEEYLDAILDTYFNVLQDESGKIVNFGIHWASITGAVIDSFCASAKKYEKIYKKYIEGAFKAFLWIKAQIDSTYSDKLQTPGLFPADHDSDYPAVAQSWARTDVWNLLSIEALGQVLEKYGDERYLKVYSFAKEYRKTITDIFEKFAKQAKNEKYLVLPEDPKNDKELEKHLRKAHPHHGQFSPFILLHSGIAGYGTENAEKVIAYFRDELKDHQNGLVLPFNEVNITSKGTQWYLNWLEYKLYFYYRKAGKPEIAKEFLQAQLKYAMTNEFYMAERYDDHDAYFTPWCPNCSAAGRTIMMLCDWYDGKNEEL